MIEYDKANVTQSYPSLTKYEVATLLDKAYLALIGQKVTGNNYRKAGFETDIKSVTDLAPLVVTATSIDATTEEYEDTDIGLYPTSEKYLRGMGGKIAKNLAIGVLPKDFLYFVNSVITTTGNKAHIAKLVSHQMAEDFFETSVNIPWIKGVVVFIDKVLTPDIENGKQDAMIIVYDRHNYEENTDVLQNVTSVSLTYVKKPNKFVGEDAADFSDTTEFECNDSMAEELITLAISFALENVESQRFNTNLAVRRLEA